MNVLVSTIGVLSILFIPGWLITVLVYPVWSCHVRSSRLVGMGFENVAIRICVSVLLSIFVTTLIVFIHLRFFSIDRSSLFFTIFGVSSILLILVVLRYALHLNKHT